MRRYGFIVGFIVGAVLASAVHGPDVAKFAILFACSAAGILWAVGAK